MEKYLLSLKAEKSPGPDGVPMRILKLCATELGPPTSLMLNIICPFPRVCYLKNGSLLIFRFSDFKKVRSIREKTIVKSLLQGSFVKLARIENCAE